MLALFSEKRRTVSRLELRLAFPCEHAAALARAARGCGDACRAAVELVTGVEMIEPTLRRRATQRTLRGMFVFLRFMFLLLLRAWTEAADPGPVSLRPSELARRRWGA